MELPLNRVDPDVISSMYSLRFKDAYEITSAFSGVPTTSVEGDEDFLRTLRLVTTSHCSMKCSYPDEKKLWCHNEGITRDGHAPASMDKMVEVVRLFHEKYQFKRVALAGLQPLLNDELLWFIATIRDIGIEHVSLTSHGLGLLKYLERLKEAGLNDIQLSVQNFSQSHYKAIMGLDMLSNVMRVVERSKEIGLGVAVNRVLLRGFVDDIPEVLQWIQANDLRVRLYDVMWQPGHDDYFRKYFISWQETLDSWKHEVERIVVWNYGTSGRVNLVFELSGGGSIETNLPLPPLKSSADACKTCWMAPSCTEGYLGCGLRITPDLQAKPCLLRNDLSMSILPLLEDGGSVEGLTAIDAMLNGDAGLQMKA